MKLRLVALVLAIASCRGSSDKPSERVLVTLTRDRGTPTWLGIIDDQLLIAQTTGDPGKEAQTLTAVDVATTATATREVAASLPSGRLALHAGKLFLAQFGGEIGRVDLASGAYTKLATLPTNVLGFTVSNDGAYVGANHRAVLIDASALSHDVPGSDIGNDVDEVIATPAGVFAAGHLGDAVMRLDAPAATIFAPGQPSPHFLAATRTRLVWAVGDNGHVGQRLVAMPLSGGAPSVLAVAHPPGQIVAIATDDTRIVCAMAADGMYVVADDNTIRFIKDVNVSRVAIGGGRVYWVEDSDAGWLVKSVPL